LDEGRFYLNGVFKLAAANPTDVRILLEKKKLRLATKSSKKTMVICRFYIQPAKLQGEGAQIAATLAQNNFGGKGNLLGGVPGVPPAEIVIIGAGNVGSSAAQTFLGMGATVYLLDQNLRRLHEIDTLFKGRVITMVSHDFNVAKVCRFADVLVGAVLVPGARSPIVVTRDMVRTMRPHSIIIDVSIDQGDV
jgi:alanine dehydrogenase